MSSHMLPLPHSQLGRRHRDDSDTQFPLTLVRPISRAPPAVVASLRTHSNPPHIIAKRARLSGHLICAPLSAHLVSGNGAAEDRRAAAAEASAVTAGGTCLDKPQDVCVATGLKKPPPAATAAPLRIRITSRVVGKQPLATREISQQACPPSARLGSPIHTGSTAAILPSPNVSGATVATAVIDERKRTSATAGVLATGTKSPKGTATHQSRSKSSTTKSASLPTRRDTFVDPCSVSTASPSAFLPADAHPALRGKRCHRMSSPVPNTLELVSHRVIIGDVDASKKAVVPLTAGCQGNLGDQRKQRNSGKSSLGRSGTSRATRPAHQTPEAITGESHNPTSVEVNKRVSQTHVTSSGRKATPKALTHNVFSRLYQPPLAAPIGLRVPHTKNPPCVPMACASHQRGPQRRLTPASSLSSLQHALNSFVFPPRPSLPQSDENSGATRGSNTNTSILST